MTGEQHERAVEEALYRAFRWLAVQRNPETRFEGSESEYVEAQFGAMLDAYLRSLAEQGVVLVDLREVVAWLRERHTMQQGGLSSMSAWGRMADAIERRFGGNERSD